MKPAVDSSKSNKPCPEIEIPLVSDSEFLNLIRDQISQGFSITPFVGSGISAPSGILMGLEFEEYLAYVVYLSLHKEWDVRRNGWPAHPTDEQVQTAKRELFENFKECLERYQCVGVVSGESVGEKVLGERDRRNRDTCKIEHVVSRIYELKIETRPLPKRGNRLIIVNRSRSWWSPLRKSLKITVYDDTPGGSNGEELEPGELLSEELAKIAGEFDNWWNRELPERKKADLMRQLQSCLNPVLDPGSIPSGAYDTLKKLPESAFPVPSSHKLNIQIKRPLVPTIFRSDNIRRDEEHFDQLRKDMKFEDRPSDPNESRTSAQYIQDRALRSPSHWTRTLEFLSRIRPKMGRAGAWMDDLDISVIDSFNAHITRDRHPNLIHNMVARLSRSLRSRVILSTNFDTLIEQSFRSQGEPLQVFAVSAMGGLPNHATVRAQDCLIKLHGDILETRADSSINEPPTPKDKESFFNYLRGSERSHLKQPADFLPSHLLVFGYSGNDARCIQMIKYVLDLDPDFKVFWICFNEGDRRQVNRLFRDYVEKDKDRDQRIVTTLTERTDLLLWELFQTLNLSLPGGGYSFQFSYQIPPIPFALGWANPEGELELEVKALGDELLRATDSGSHSGDDKNRKNKIVFIDQRIGVASRMYALYRHLGSKWMKTLWFELDDVNSPTHLLNAIVLSISLRIGAFQREWHRAPSDGDIELNAAYLRQFIEKHRLSPTDWVFFLYARNGPGVCCGWNLSYWDEIRYAELATLLNMLREVGFRIVYMPYGDSRDTGNRKKVEKVDAYLHQRIDPNLSETGRLRNSEDYCEWKRLAWGEQSANPSFTNPVAIPVYDTLEAKSSPATRDCWHPLDLHGATITTDEPESEETYEEILEDVLKEFGGPDKKNDADAPLKSARMMWLYGLTLFRQARHKTAMLSEAVFPCPARFGYELDNDEIRSLFLFGIDNVSAETAGVAPKTLSNFMRDFIPEDGDEIAIERKGWVHWLAERKLLLKKPGGYSWKYRDARLGIQYLLEQQGEFVFFSDALNLTTDLPDKKRQRKQTFDSIWRLRGRIHYWVGDWYLRAYHSTQHHIPLLEAIYHTVQALIHSPYLSAAKERQVHGEEDISGQRLAFRSLCQLRKLIHTGKKALQFWMPGVDLDKTYFHGLANDRGRLGKFVKLGAFADKSPLNDRIRAEISNVEMEFSVLVDSVNSEGVAHGTRRQVYNSLLRSGDNYNGPENLLNFELAHTVEDIDKGDDWAKDVISELSGAGLDTSLLENIMLVGGKLKLDGAKIYEDFSALRALVFEWWSGMRKNGRVDGYREEDLLQLIWVLSELAYRTARRATLIRYSRGKLANANMQELERSHWKVTSGICHMAIQLLRSISPNHYHTECKLRIQLLTLYGMALGYLKRFKEGHRRFNEAHALLVSGLGKLDGRELSKIHIRRAEMILTRGRSLLHAHIEDKTGEDALLPIRACVDDAWASLETASIGMRGVNHSSFWWYRLRILELKTFAFLSHIDGSDSDTNAARTWSALPFRRRHSYPVTIVDLLRDCLILAGNDVFRQLRAINHFLEAVRLLPAVEGYGYGDEISNAVLIPCDDGPDKPPFLVGDEDTSKQSFAQINSMITDCWRKAKLGTEKAKKEPEYATLYFELLKDFIENEMKLPTLSSS